MKIPLKVSSLILMKRKNNSGCKIRFFGSLQNVATFTDYEGIDPEIYGGIDNNFYPRPQTGVFGVTFEF